MTENPLVSRMECAALGSEDGPIILEALRTIQSLEAENARLREALRQIRDFDEVPSYGHLLKDIARASLAQEQIAEK